MGEITAMVVVATIAYTIYRLFELFARRKERMSIIEKLSDGLDPQLLQDSFSMPAPKVGSASWSIRLGLLLLGVGLGVIVATIVELSVIFPYAPRGDEFHQYRNVLNVFYPACGAVFGGIGLVIAYFIEEKKDRKRNSVGE